VTCRSREEDFRTTTITDRMVVSEVHAQFSSAAMDDLDGSKASITASPVRTFAKHSRAVLERDNGRLVER
jgi:hypothetical protein